LFICSLVVATALVAQGETAEKCKEPTYLYEEMGCTSEGKTAENPCPTHYNCSFLENAPEDQCYHRGKLYPKGKRVQNGPLDGCFAKLCQCADNGNFICAAVDCWSRNWDKLEKGCHFKNDFTKCCQTGEHMICPKTQPDVSACEVDGKTYYEGEYFNPQEDNCLTCICDKGFTGKLEAPFCKRLNCSSPHYSDQTIFRENCALYFIDKAKSCCPADNTCPTGKEVFDKSKASNDNNLHCMYGQEQLPVGTTFETTLNGRRYPRTEKASCECILPPLVTCTKIHNEEEALKPE